MFLQFQNGYFSKVKWLFWENCCIVADSTLFYLSFDTHDSPSSIFDHVEVQIHNRILKCGNIFSQISLCTFVPKNHVMRRPSVSAWVGGIPWTINQVIKKGTMVNIIATKCDGIRECLGDTDERYCGFSAILTLFLGNLF